MSLSPQECREKAFECIENAKKRLGLEGQRNELMLAQVYATLSLEEGPVVYKTQFTGGLDQMDR